MDGALTSLRAQIIRDRGPGLEHVEALILLRGCELQPVALKNERTLRGGALKRIILAAAQDPPQDHAGGRQSATGGEAGDGRQRG